MFTLNDFKLQNENGEPRYNIFYLYFTSGEYFVTNKSQDFYKKFEAENKLLIDELRSALSNILNIEKEERNKYIEPHIHTLYEAYVKMMNCGATNKDLLGY